MYEDDFPLNEQEDEALAEVTSLVLCHSQVVDHMVMLNYIIRKSKIRTFLPSSPVIHNKLFHVSCY